jgi:hypothetical protein
MRRIRRFRWAALAYLVVWAGGMVLIRVLFAYPVALLALVPAVIIAAVALGVRKVRRGGEPVRSVLCQRRQRARARVDSAGKLRAEAPLAAGCAALVSFFAVFLALVATRSFGTKGVYLPPAADARWQLWCIAIALAGAVVALDCWLGLGTCVKALADGFTAAIVGVTIALAVTSPLMIFWQVGSRPAWLAAMAAQFTWPFAGGILGATVSGRRKRRLSPPAPRRSQASWLAEYGIDANRDLVLVSPGSRKILVINAVSTLTGMRLKEAKDLVDNAPRLVMHQVTSGRADQAKELLESLGATVTVSSDPGQAECGAPAPRHRE